MIPFADVTKVLESVGLVSGLGAEEVRRRLATGVQLEDTGQRMLAFYLEEMDRGGLYQASGHGSTAHYAEAQLGIDRRRTSELVAIGRKLLTLSAIDRAFCKREIGWSKVRHLVAVAVPEHEEAWLARAQQLTCKQLALQVKLTKPGSPPRKSGDMKGLPEIRFDVRARLGTLTYQKFDLAQKKVSAECGRALSLEEFFDALADLALHVEEDGSVPGKVRVDSSLYRIVLREGGGERDGDAGPLTVETDLGPIPVEEADCIRCDALAVSGEGDVEDPDRGRIDPKTPDWLRARILQRDGFRCRCCRSPYRLMVHHVQWRSEHGRTKSSNLITLCAKCHGLVHDRLLVLLGTEERGIQFVDGNGNALDRAGPPPDGAVPIEPPVLPATPLAGAEPASLASVPETIDGGWWKRHRHLLRFLGRGIEMLQGLALPKASAEEPEPPSPVPDPEAFRGMVGQDDRIRRLTTAREASEARGDSFPHTILTGPAGTGKTSFAERIARSIGSRLLKATGPILQNVFLLIRLLADLRERDVLFLEEIHAAPRVVVEALYEAMAEGRITLTLEDGAEAKTVSFEVPRFTVIAATTEPADLPAAFRSRFGLQESLGYYRPEDLERLLVDRARSKGFTLSPEASRVLAAHSRETPREALRPLDRVLDDTTVAGRTGIDEKDACDSLAGLGYDEDGLAPLERRYMEILREARGPVPLSRLAALLGESARAIANDVEPYLFRRGLVRMTLQGRVACPYARKPDFRPSELSERADNSLEEAPALVASAT